MDGRASKFDKIMYFQHFSKTIRYFFLAVSSPIKRFFKTYSEKNSKKIEIFSFVKKNRVTFFSAIFSIFYQKPYIYQKLLYIFFPVVSRPHRKLLKTFSEKNSKKI